MAQVSVVIPVYNMAKYLPRCFASLQAQTMPDWETLLVDDGSPDNSGEICDEWAAKDDRFRVIHKANGGVCSARNAGLAAAQSAYAVLMDQDDLLAPCALEALLAVQKRFPGDFVLGLHTEIRKELPEGAFAPGTPVQRYAARQASYLYNDAPFPPPWGKLLDLDLMRRYGVRFDETIRDGYEDRPFMRDYLAAHWQRNAAARCTVVQLPLYFWERDNAESVSSSGRQPLKPWHLAMFDGFLTDCLNVYHVPPKSLQFYALEYVQTLAFSLSCLPEDTLEQDAAWIYEDPALGRLLDYFKRNKLYTVFYTPLCRKDTRLVAKLSRGRLENNAFYWHRYKLGRCLHPTWADWKGLDAIVRE